MLFIKGEGMFTATLNIAKGRNELYECVYTDCDWMEVGVGVRTQLKSEQTHGIDDIFHFQN